MTTTEPTITAPFVDPYAGDPLRSLDAYRKPREVRIPIPHQGHNPLRNRLVAAYRTPQDPPPPPKFTHQGRQVNQDLPAPAWVAWVVDAVLARCTRTPDAGAGYAIRALNWCGEGDAVARAEQFITFVHVFPGEREKAIDLFLTSAVSTKAGKKARAPKPVGAQ